MVPIGLVLKMVIGETNDKFIRIKDEKLITKKTNKKSFNLNKEQLKALKFLEKKIINLM